MKNLKKTGLAALVAILAFSFSAFTTVKNRIKVRYYKVNMAYSSPNDPNGYEYYDDDHCETVGLLCSAEWILTGAAPTVDGTPLPLTGVTFVTGSVAEGHFEY